MVDALLEALRRQTWPEIEVILVKGVSPQGKAINQGAARARGDVLVIMDDDSRPADERVVERLVRVLREDGRIGMAGASVVPPPEATPFQRRLAREFPRFSVPVVDRVTESDMACHGCCAFPRTAFDAAGRENEEIVRGLDPDLRTRLRRLGYRVVLAPGCVVYHPLPATLRGFLRLMYRNGLGSAQAQRTRPDLVYRTEEDVRRADAAFVPFPVRVVRYPLRLAGYLLSLRLLRFAGSVAYAAGAVRGFSRGRC